METICSAALFYYGKAILCSLGVRFDFRSILVSRLNPLARAEGLPIRTTIFWPVSRPYR